MKHIHMTWSLVALSSSLHLGAAASSTQVTTELFSPSDQGTVTFAGEQVKKALYLEHSKKFVTINAALNAHNENIRFFKEQVARGFIRKLKAIKQLDAHLAIKPPKSEARQDVHAELLSTTPSLVPTVYTFDSKTKQFIPCKHKSKNLGIIETGKHYCWEKECSVTEDGITGFWRPQELDYVSAESAPVGTLTALKNAACSSICSLDNAGLANRAHIKLLEKHLPVQAQRFNALHSTELMATIKALKERRDDAIAQLRLERNEDRAAAHRIRAVVNYFSQGSSKDEIFKEAFGSKIETQNGRFSIVRMVAEIVSRVKDPTYRPYFGSPVENPNEPQNVKDLQAAMLARNAAASEETQRSCDEQVLAVQAEAIKYLNSLVTPILVATEHTRKETEAFDTAVVNAYKLIQQYREAKQLLAALTGEVSSAAASSSSAV